MKERTNWGTIIVDIVIIIVASQTTWVLLWLLLLTGSYKLKEKIEENKNINN